MVMSSSGMPALTRRLDEGEYDTLIVGAGLEIPTASPGLVRLLRSSSANARRVASICLGAFVLGDAGLLSGRRATTHWRYAAALQERFPSCRVDMDKIFIEDGTVWTSAGMTAGIDLVIGMIERDHGSELARTVAKSLVMYHRRSGGQSQHSALLDLNAREDRVQQALNFARAKGVRRKRIVNRHVLRNILIPVVTVIGIEFGSLVAFSTITETVFAWPGMGKLLIDSVYQLDRPVVVAYVLLATLLFVVVNFLVDVLYAALDPRVKLAGEQA